ncbi:histone-fold-containing protein [Zopfia rhizophila CBS 207.26]|uniref:Histone-fold-containing protein n=1 Tax=Zopfia rhizophila CBS 207.26 TaxID=1314779 RepID=A0A6A6DW56_9PEZI|nr:histone-fold-containing protein [Zopfia rhizophila CBS 207.26]
MPYNNTPIAPSQEVSGQVSLPLARVQKIIAADPDRTHVSKNASFAIALATEMFIQHLATTTHNVVKAERKPRRNIQYRDVSAAVSKTDNLEFLVDVVPKTVTYKEFKKKREAEGKSVGKGPETGVNGQNGQTTIAGPSGFNSNLTNGNGVAKGDAEQNGRIEERPEVIEVKSDDEGPEAMEVDDRGVLSSTVEEEGDPAAMQIKMEMRGPRANGTDPAVAVKPASSGFTAINGTK